jgi:hypothetical protein
MERSSEIFKIANRNDPVSSKLQNLTKIWRLFSSDHEEKPDWNQKRAAKSKHRLILSYRALTVANGE